MGVPVIGLLGGHPMSRFGCSLLAYSGLTGLIAESPEEYAERANHVANDTPTLNRLRRSFGRTWPTPRYSIHNYLSRD